MPYLVTFEMPPDNFGIVLIDLVPTKPCICGIQRTRNQMEIVRAHLWGWVGEEEAEFNSNDWQLLYSY